MSLRRPLQEIFLIAVIVLGVEGAVGLAGAGDAPWVEIGSVAVMLAVIAVEVVLRRREGRALHGAG